MLPSISESIVRRKSPIFSVLIAFFVLSVLNGCDSGGSGGDPELLISGTITSSVDGAPISGATVELLTDIGFILIPFGDPTLLITTLSGMDGNYSIEVAVDHCSENGLALGVGLQGYKTTVVLSANSGFTLGETDTSIITTNAGAFVRCQKEEQTINISLTPLAGQGT